MRTEDPQRVLLGRFRLDRLLARGTVGEVYLAQDLKNDGRPAAVKFLRRDMEFPDIITRFEREALLVSRVRSPHVASVYTAGQDGTGRYWIAFQFVDGEQLAELQTERLPDGQTRAKALPLGDVSWIMEHVFLGLEHAHEAGVIHRDISLTNIMVRQSPVGERHACIIDFGIGTAKDMTIMTGRDDFVGHRLFSAPEQLDDPSTVTTAADIYSAATVAFYALTGKLPYKLEQHRGGRYNPSRLAPRSLAQVTGTRWPDRLESFFQHSLRARPAERVQDARAARQLWSAACG